MPDHELQRLLTKEKDALARYGRVRLSFERAPDVVESARSIWAEAKAALLKYEEDSGA